jgi:hypothetical protein
MPKKILIATLAGVSLAAIATAAAMVFEALRSPRSHGALRAAGASSGASPAPDDLRARISVLSHRVQELERRAVTAPMAATAPQEQSPAPDETELSSDALRGKRTELLAQLARITDDFQHEPVDADWARSMSARIQDVLAQASIGSTRVLSASCRSSLCRIEARHADQASRDAFASIRRGIPGNFWIQHVDPDDERGDGTLRTIAFFARPGHERDNALYDLMYTTRD